MRPTTAFGAGPQPLCQRFHVRRLDGHESRRQALLRQRAAADHRPAVDHRRARADGSRPACARASSTSSGVAIMRQTGTSAVPRRGSSAPAWRRGRRAALVHAQRSGQGVAAQLLNQLTAPSDNARLRATQQLVAGEHHQVRARPSDSWASAPAAARTVACRAGSRDPTSSSISSPLSCARSPSPQLGRGDEADDAEVARMDPHQGGCLAVRSRGVVGKVVRFVVPTSTSARRSGHHVRHAETTADLDELPARMILRGPSHRATSTSSRAEALLFTATPLQRRLRGRPGRRHERNGSRAPRCRGRTPGCCSRGSAVVIAATAASDKGARPRFVWMITPVALITGRSDGRSAS